MDDPKVPIQPSSAHSAASREANRVDSDTVTTMNNSQQPGQEAVEESDNWQIMLVDGCTDATGEGSCTGGDSCSCGCGGCGSCGGDDYYGS